MDFLLTYHSVDGLVCFNLWGNVANAFINIGGKFSVYIFAFNLCLSVCVCAGTELSHRDFVSTFLGTTILFPKVAAIINKASGFRFLQIPINICYFLII